MNSNGDQVLTPQPDQNLTTVEFARQFGKTMMIHSSEPRPKKPEPRRIDVELALSIEPSAKKYIAMSVGAYRNVFHQPSR